MKVAFTEERLIPGYSPDVVWDYMNDVVAPQDESLAQMTYDNLDEDGHVQVGSRIQLRVTEKGINENVPRPIRRIAKKLIRPIGFAVITYLPPEKAPDGSWTPGERIDQLAENLPNNLFSGTLARLVSEDPRGTLMAIEADFDVIRIPGFNPEPLLSKNIRKLLADAAANLS